MTIRLPYVQRVVLVSIAHGLSNEQIAADLGTSVESVRTNVTRLFMRLGAANRAHAVALGFRAGLFEGIEFRPAARRRWPKQKKCQRRKGRELRGREMRYQTGDQVEHQLLPGWVMDVLAVDDCTTPDHQAVQVINTEGEHEWLCVADVQPAAP